MLEHKIHRDLSFDFDRLVIQIVRAISPLAHCIQRRLHQKQGGPLSATARVMTPSRLMIGLHNYRSFNVKLLGNGGYCGSTLWIRFPSMITDWRGVRGLAGTLGSRMDEFIHN